MVWAGERQLSAVGFFLRNFFERRLSADFVQMVVEYTVVVFGELRLVDVVNASKAYSNGQSVGAICSVDKSMYSCTIRSAGLTLARAREEAARAAGFNKFSYFNCLRLLDFSSIKHYGSVNDSF